MFLRLFRMACVLGLLLWANGCSFGYFSRSSCMRISPKQLHAKLLWHKNSALGPANTWNRPGGTHDTLYQNYPMYWVAEEWHTPGVRNVIVIAQIDPEDDSVYEKVYPNMWQYDGHTLCFEDYKLYFETDRNGMWTSRMLTSSLEPLTSYIP